MTIRAFPPEPLASAPEAGASWILDDAESRYVSRVRRAAVGTEIEVHDNARGWWRARIDGHEGKRVRVTLCAPLPAPAARPPVSLWVGLPDPAAVMELLPGACELDAHELVLVRCERSQGEAPGSARIARVLRAAMRQCGRDLPPCVRGPISLAAALTEREEGPARPAFLACAERRHGLTRLPTPLPTGARLLVGPEGGLTPAEIGACHAAGFTPLSLGPWVLRTPTAALALLAQATAAAAPTPC